MAKQEIINGNVHTYDDAGRLITVCTASLVPQADILSTPAEIKSDDAEVAALMMEADITAPIKEQCEENARLMRENAELKKELLAAEIKNKELTAKVKRYLDSAISLIELAGDVRA